MPSSLLVLPRPVERIRLRTILRILLRTCLLIFLFLLLDDVLNVFVKLPLKVKIDLLIVVVEHFCLSHHAQVFQSEVLLLVNVSVVILGYLGWNIVFVIQDTSSALSKWLSLSVQVREGTRLVETTKLLVISV